MFLKYNIEVEVEAIQASLSRLTNQIYKLLPIREEGGDWMRPLEAIMEELAGMDRLFIERQSEFYKLICKLEGLFSLTKADDFMIYRSIIFECLGLIGGLQKCL